MFKGGGAALEAARRRAGRAVGKPVFGIAVLTPVVLAMSVGASAPLGETGTRHHGHHAGSRRPPSHPTIPGGVHRGGLQDTPPAVPHRRRGAVRSPPPAVVISSPGSLRIPAIVLNAYRNAERMMAAAEPGCGMSWNILAGIGRIESMHANGGSTDINGTAVRPIYGPRTGRHAARQRDHRAEPQQRPGHLRARHGTDAVPARHVGALRRRRNGDGKADVQNVFDATLAAARYLCGGGLNMRDPNQAMTAILRYNNSVAYAQNVLGWARAYATGVVPVNLPPPSPDRCRRWAMPTWTAIRRASGPACPP